MSLQRKSGQLSPQPIIKESGLLRAEGRCIYRPTLGSTDSSSRIREFLYSDANLSGARQVTPLGVGRKEGPRHTGSSGGPGCRES